MFCSVGIGQVIGPGSGLLMIFKLQIFYLQEDYGPELSIMIGAILETGTMV